MPSLKQSQNNGEHISLDDVCFLMSETIIVDELQQEIITYLPELVYCSKLSIGQGEYSVTVQNGLKAKFTLVIDYDEYDGEKEVEYERKLYSVYRTFVRKDGYIELYCEERVGNEN